MEEKRSEVITVRVDGVTKKKLEEIAKTDDRKLGYLVNKILKEYVKTK